MASLRCTDTDYTDLWFSSCMTEAFWLGYGPRAFQIISDIEKHFMGGTGCIA